MIRSQLGRAVASRKWVRDCGTAFVMYESIYIDRLQYGSHVSFNGNFQFMFKFHSLFVRGTCFSFVTPAHAAPLVSSFCSLFICVELRIFVSLT